MTTPASTPRAQSLLPRPSESVSSPRFNYAYRYFFWSSVAFERAGSPERMARRLRDPRKVDKAFGTHLLVLAYTGVRFGESAALRRGSVDILRRRLIVSENLVEVSGTLIFGTPKTGAERAIPLPASVLQRLQQHLDQEVGPSADALLFTASNGSPLRYSNWRHNRFSRVRDASELPSELTPHHLRHTTAALLIHQGTHPKAVQQILGHSSTQVTFDIYRGLFEADLDSVADRLEASFQEAVADSVRTADSIARIGRSA